MRHHPTPGEAHELGAQLGRELLAGAPPSDEAPRPLAGVIFDFAEAIELVGRLDLEEAC